MQRDHPRLAELRVSDDEAVRRDVVQRQCEGFADAQAGCGDETEQVVPGQRGDGAGGPHGQCRRQQFPDVRDRYQVRLRSPFGQMTQSITGRHLVTWVLGVQPAGKGMHRVAGS